MWKILFCCLIALVIGEKDSKQWSHKFRDEILGAITSPSVFGKNDSNKLRNKFRYDVSKAVNVSFVFGGNDSKQLGHKFRYEASKSIRVSFVFGENDSNPLHNKFHYEVFSSSVDSKQPETCSQKLYNLCGIDVNNYTASRIPENEDELNEFCSDNLKLFECAAGEKFVCEDPASILPQLMKDVYPVLKNVCRKDSALRDDLFESSHGLTCLQRIKRSPYTYYYNNNCKEWKNNSSRRPNFIEKFQYENILEGIFENATEECLDIITVVGCVVGHIGLHCGGRQFRIAVDIILSFDFPFRSCNERVKEAFPYIAEEYLNAVLNTLYKNPNAVANTLQKNPNAGANTLQENLNALAIIFQKNPHAVARNRKKNPKHHASIKIRRGPDGKLRIVNRRHKKHRKHRNGKIRIHKRS